jgi:hypothetical protein
MCPNALALPSAPDGIRTFRGFRRDGLARDKFLADLGSTFMPGTPLMQAPLGLWSYLPAVLDWSSPEQQYPDEVAIIVYLSRAVYDAKRESSLSRRMYTASHTAVFDMARSAGQFPTPIDEPLDAAAHSDADAWYLSREPVDWQDGATRIGFVAPSTPDVGFPAALRSSVRSANDALRQQGCDQVVALATPAYGALWMHFTTGGALPLPTLNILPADTTVERDLECQRAIVRGDEDTGVDINGPAAFSFLFSRDLSYLGGEPA